jgi:hypothetical protein
VGLLGIPTDPHPTSVSQDLQKMDLGLTDSEEVNENEKKRKRNKTLLSENTVVYV